MPVRSAPRIVVEGQRDLERRFLQLRREVVAGMRVELLQTAERVREDAHQRVLQESSVPEGVPHKIEASRWDEFRLGITTTSGIGALGAIGLGPTRTPMMYVAPKARRRGGPQHKNLAPLLSRVMQASADKYEAQVWAEVEALVDAQVAKANF